MIKKIDSDDNNDYYDTSGGEKDKEKEIILEDDDDYKFLSIEEIILILHNITNMEMEIEMLVLKVCQSMGRIWNILMKKIFEFVD